MSRQKCALLWSLIPVTFAACSTSPTTPSAHDATAGSASSATSAHSDRAGIGISNLSFTAPVNIDPRRSLAVTDDAILASFSFQAVMDQLVAQAGVPGLTSLQLFQQWWSTAVTCPPPDPKISHFAYQCPRAEGQQAQQNPFVSPSSDLSYTPIGLFNRFDLAPADGSDCGEYRVVFARRSGFTNSLQRNLVIFEAVLPNPNYFLTPGMFGNMRLASGGTQSALLVPDSAIQTDQARKTLLVVGKDGKVVVKPVQLGPVVDGLRVVASGISPTDKVIISGTQMALPGMPVDAHPGKIAPDADAGATPSAAAPAAAQATFAG
jgi:hypothetical protein